MARSRINSKNTIAANKIDKTIPKGSKTITSSNNTSKPNKVKNLKVNIIKLCQSQKSKS